jgi:hypothetical protein
MLQPGVIKLVVSRRSRPAPVQRELYAAAERLLNALLTREDLDAWRVRDPYATASFEATVDVAIDAAYRDDDPAAHLFLQRVLYRINRLTLFWYDDLLNYQNERSPFLRALLARIEQPWQAWELAQLDLAAIRREEDAVPRRLCERAGHDVDPPTSASGRYFREQATLEGYRRLLEIASVDALVEASQLSRTLGGASNAIHAMMTRLLVEEYGGGRLDKKHSSHFRVMLNALDMDSRPEAYLGACPWEVLAGINHSFLLCDRKRFFLRYVGGLLYTEVSVPSAFQCYRDAASRLGLPAQAMAYWDLHIKEDRRHGPWMLHDVALPLAQRYPDDAWELLLGYDQQRRMSARAGAAVAREAIAADGAAAVTEGREEAAR